MNAEKLSKSITTDGNPPAPGFKNGPAPQPIGANGQHEAYWVLSEEERAKGFVRPVRRSYRHVGPTGPRYPLRELDEDQREYYRAFNYTHFEPYPEGESALIGRFWTQVQLDKVNKGCRSVTTMGLALCETYARDPSYYGSTFCCGCGTHLPVGEFRWVEDDAIVGS